MGSVFGCFGPVLVSGEKFAIWIACTVIMCCLMATVTGMLIIGVGVGYNYGFVDMASRYRYVPQQYYYPDSPRWPYRGGINEGLSPRGAYITLTPIIRQQPSEETLSRIAFSRTTNVQNRYRRDIRNKSNQEIFENEAAEPIDVTKALARKRKYLVLAQKAYNKTQIYTVDDKSDFFVNSSSYRVKPITGMKLTMLTFMATECQFRVDILNIVINLSI